MARFTVTRPTDPEAILRITYLAWALGQQDVMVPFLDAAAATLRNAAAIRRAEAHQLQGLAADVGAEAFPWLKTQLEAARLEAQSKELKHAGRRHQEK